MHISTIFSEKPMYLPTHIKADSLEDFYNQLEELKLQGIVVTVFGKYFVCSNVWDRILYDPIDVTIGNRHYKRDPMVVRYHCKQRY